MSVQFHSSLHLHLPSNPNKNPNYPASAKQEHPFNKIKWNKSGEKDDKL